MKAHEIRKRAIALLLVFAFAMAPVNAESRRTMQAAMAGDVVKQCGEVNSATEGAIEYPLEATYGSCTWRPGTFRFIDITAHLGNRVYFTDTDGAAFHIFDYNKKKQLDFVKRIDLREIEGVGTFSSSLIYGGKIYFYDKYADSGNGEFYELVNDSSFENQTTYIRNEIKNNWENFLGNITDYLPMEVCQKLTGSPTNASTHATILKHSNGCYYVFINRVGTTGEKQSDLKVYDKDFKLKFTKKYEKTGITTVYDVAEGQGGNIYIADSCGSLATKLSPAGKVLVQKEEKYTSGHGGLTAMEDGNVIYSGSNVEYQVNILDKNLKRVNYCGEWSYQQKGDFLNAGYVTGDSAGNAYILDGEWQNTPFNRSNARVSVFKGKDVKLYNYPELCDFMDATSAKYDGNVYYLNHADWRSDTAGGYFAYIDQKKNQYVRFTVKGYEDQEFRPIRMAVADDGSIYSYNSDSKLYRLTRNKNNELAVKKTISGKYKPIKMDCDSDGKLYLLYLKADSPGFSSGQLCLAVYNKELKLVDSITLGRKGDYSRSYYSRTNYSQENGLICNGMSDYPDYTLFGIDLNDKLYYMNETFQIIRMDLKTMAKETIHLEGLQDTPLTWMDLYGNIYTYLAYDGEVQYDQAVYKYRNPDSKAKVSTGNNTAVVDSVKNEAVLKTRSKEEIKKAWAKYYKPYDSEKYQTQPSTMAPYSAGSLKEKFIAEGVAATNLVRYIAGLPDDIVADKELNKEAQYGAVLLDKAGIIDHNPEKPEDMEEDFYQLAVEATRTSNLYLGVDNYTQAVFGYMTEVANVNKSSVGHRRWILNPNLAKVGFGWAGDASVMKVFDESRKKKIDYDFIAYPSKGYYPTELFDNGAVWSVQPNPEKYDSSKQSGITVTIVDMSTKKKVDTDLLSVDNNWQGIPYCISFIPKGKLSVKDGSEYEVSIAGLIDKSSGKETKITYQTKFFDVE